VARSDHVQRLPVQAVFVDLGLVPNTQIVRQLVQLDEQGFIVIDDQNRASLPGLFAAGDVTSVTCEQMLIAIGTGARAAQSVYDYILAQRLGLESRSVGTPYEGDTTRSRTAPASRKIAATARSEEHHERRD